MAKYGIPYMGSKDKICEDIIRIMPPATHFYDLFGGGFSITHSMHVNRPKAFKHFHFNEIKKDIVELIKKAIAGEFNYNVFKPKWVSREEFLKNITDPYIRICWSFGNNQKNYLFGPEIEHYKKSMHNAIVFNDFDDLANKVFGHDGFEDGYDIMQRRLFLRSRIEFFRKNGIPNFLHKFLNERQLQQLERLQQLQLLEQLLRLERLQQLHQLEQLQRLERLSFTSVSYNEVPIENDAVIYCDPPYQGTAEYGIKFDHKKFLDWADSISQPVFISEYKIHDKRFRPVKRVKKRSMLTKEKHKTQTMSEHIYVNRAGLARLFRK